MEKDPLVSIIIYNHNGRKYFKACFGVAMAQTYKNIEIVVVDCGSSDGSAEEIRQNYSSLRLIGSDKDIGFAAANNLGINSSAGEYVLCLNLDVIMSENFVEEMVRELRSGEKVGSVSGKLLSRWGTFHNIIDTTGHLMDVARRPMNRGMGEVDNAQYDGADRRTVFGACAAASLYKREMLEDVKIDGQYYDESFFAYLEDVDLDWRAALAGWKSVYTPKAVAFHERLGLNRHKPREVQMLTFRNSLLMLMKNETFPNFLMDLPYYAILIFWRIIRELILFPYLFATFLGFISMLPQTLRKRQMIMGKRRVSSSYMLGFFRKTETNIRDFAEHFLLLVFAIFLIAVLGLLRMILIYAALVIISAAIKTLLGLRRTYPYPESKS